MTVEWALNIGVWLAVTVLLAAAALLLVRRSTRRIASRTASYLQRYDLFAGLAGRAEALTRLIGIAVAAVVVGAAVLAILAILAVDITPALDVLRQAGQVVVAWLLTSGLRVLLILILAYVSFYLIRRAGPRLVETVVLKDKEGVEREEAQKRAQTLSGVLVGTGVVVVALVAGFMALAELGVNLAPMLAGFGIAGIAVGFGAQNLVRDIISGIFVLLEDQYREGDVASVGGKTGLVEKVNLRRTILRDLDGIVHVIPNGEITVSSNYTKDFSRVNIDIPVAYHTDLDHAFRVLNRIGEELAQDEYFGPLIIEPPKVLRVNNFGDSSIDIKMVGVTKPIRQWEVTGELRRRIKKAFDEEGIEIPFPHRTIYWGVGSHPLRGDSLEPTEQERLAEIQAALRRGAIPPSQPETEEQRLPDDQS